MGMRIISRVMQRGMNSPYDTEITNFEGDFLADQYIDGLYRTYWKTVGRTLDPFTVERGYERWHIDDVNSAYPLYYITHHELWNQVPPNDSRLVYHFDDGIAHGGAPTIDVDLGTI